jgi:enamine deaminase RidA (YjgF/YER057c/UK114 family)
LQQAKHPFAAEVKSHITRGLDNLATEINTLGVARGKAHELLCLDALVRSAKTDEMSPLIEKSLTALDTAHRAIQAQPEDVLRATCFVTALHDSAHVMQQLRQAYPQAALSVAQLQRQPERSMVECETVVRAARNWGLPALGGYYARLTGQAVDLAALARIAAVLEATQHKNEYAPGPPRRAPGMFGYLSAPVGDACFDKTDIAGKPIGQILQHFVRRNPPCASNTKVGCGRGAALSWPIMTCRIFWTAAAHTITASRA